MHLYIYPVHYIKPSLLFPSGFQLDHASTIAIQCKPKVTFSKKCLAFASCTLGFQPLTQVPISAIINYYNSLIMASCKACIQ